MNSVRPFVAPLLAILANVGATGAAFALTLTVNTTFDVPAATPFENGVCETEAGNGVCTLRAAIMKANHFPGGGVTIVLPANALPYKLTTVPSGADDEMTGDLNITSTLTLIGAGATKTASNTYAGKLFTGTGPAFNAVLFNPDNVIATEVGSASFTIVDGNNVVFSYSVNGVFQTKSITRQVFAPPGTVCQ